MRNNIGPEESVLGSCTRTYCQCRSLYLFLSTRAGCLYNHCRVDASQAIQSSNKIAMRFSHHMQEVEFIPCKLQLESQHWCKFWKLVE